MPDVDRATRGCWFCSGGPRDGPICARCVVDNEGLSTFLHQYDGLFIVLTPPHEEGCICEWCLAIKRTKKNERLDAEAEANRQVHDVTWKRTMVPHLPTVRLERAEPPPEKSEPRVIRTGRVDEVGAQRVKQQQRDTVSRDSHPAGGSLPSADVVFAAAQHFPPHPERPRAKTSGCWFCLGSHATSIALCEVCRYMIEDYLEYLHARPAVDL